MSTRVSVLLFAFCNWLAQGASENKGLIFPKKGCYFLKKRHHIRGKRCFYEVSTEKRIYRAQNKNRFISDGSPFFQIITFTKERITWGHITRRGISFWNMMIHGSHISSYMCFFANPSHSTISQRPHYNAADPQCISKPMVWLWHYQMTKGHVQHGKISFKLFPVLDAQY